MCVNYSQIIRTNIGFILWLNNILVNKLLNKHLVKKLF